MVAVHFLGLVSEGVVVHCLSEDVFQCLHHVVHQGSGVEGDREYLAVALHLHLLLMAHGHHLERLRSVVVPPAVALGNTERRFDLRGRDDRHLSGLGTAFSTLDVCWDTIALASESSGSEHRVHLL